MSRGTDADRGSAPVEFVLVGTLVIMLLLGVIQLGLAHHVRSTLIHAAAEGARLGARADRGPQDAVERTRSLITQSVSGAYAGDVSARPTVREGIGVLEVRVSAPLPVVGLLGPGGTVTVTGHAILEQS